MAHPSPTPTWSLETLRLPKTLDDDARLPALHAALRARAAVLWAGGSLRVPTAPWTDALAAVLEGTQRQGRLVRGLDQVEKVLEREAHGLSLVDARSATARGSRVSRLLLVSRDGTERFYRQVERLVRARGERLLAVRLDADAGQLAEVVPQAAGVLRAVMIEHKDAVARALLALYPGLSEG